MSAGGADRCPHCGCVPMMRELVVHTVTEVDGGWEVRLGPDPGDPWVTVHEADFPVSPEPGDVVRLQVPYVLGLVTP